MIWDLFSIFLSIKYTILIVFSIVGFICLVILIKVAVNEHLKTSVKLVTILMVISLIFVFTFGTLAVIGDRLMIDQVQVEIDNFTDGYDGVDLAINGKKIKVPESVITGLSKPYVIDENQGRARDNSIKAYIINVGQRYEVPKVIKDEMFNIYDKSEGGSIATKSPRYIDAYLINSNSDSINIIFVPWQGDPKRFGIYYPRYSYTATSKIADIYSAELSRIINPN